MLVKNAWAREYKCQEVKDILIELGCKLNGNRVINNSYSKNVEYTCTSINDLVDILNNECKRGTNYAEDLLVQILKNKLK